MRDLGPNEILLDEGQDYQTFDYPMLREVKAEIGFHIDADDVAHRLFSVYNDLAQEVGAQAYATPPGANPPRVVDVNPAYRERIIERAVNWEPPQDLD